MNVNDCESFTRSSIHRQIAFIRYDISYIIESSRKPSCYNRSRYHTRRTDHGGAQRTVKLVSQESNNGYKTKRANSKCMTPPEDEMREFSVHLPLTTATALPLSYPTADSHRMTAELSRGGELRNGFLSRCTRRQSL